MTDLIGTDLLYRRFEAASPKALVLLIHGLGAHTARWEFLGGFLAEKGYASYAPELRGFGRTPERPRGHVESFRIYDTDILALRAAAAAENPGKKVFLLGESLGGLIAFNLSCRNPELFAGQVLIAPAFKNGMKFPLSTYLTLAANIWINPKKTVAVPFTAAMCTRDEAYQAVMDRNPDELRVASLRLLMSSLGEQKFARKQAAELKVPTLFLAPGRDELVDEKAGRRLFGKMALSDKTLIDYPDMRHALSIERDRERVFADILAWLDSRA